MDWTQAFTIIGILGGFILWMFNKLNSDLKSLNQKLDNEINALNQKIDSNLQHLQQRSDQLYQMFIDLLKEKKQ